LYHVVEQMTGIGAVVYTELLQLNIDQSLSWITPA